MIDESHATAPRRRRLPQMSLGFMLLMMLVLAAFCAGLYRASRVPAVVRDIYITLGWQVPPSDSEIQRSLHVYFLLFTYTAPLILAGVLSTIVSICNWLARLLEPQSEPADRDQDHEQGPIAAARSGPLASSNPYTAAH